MQLPTFESGLQQDILSACHAILSLAGRRQLDEKDRMTLQAVQRCMLHSGINLDDIRPGLSPRLGTLAGDRSRAAVASFIFACMPLTREVPHPEAVALLKEVLDVAQIQSQSTGALGLLVRHHYARMRVDRFRHIFREVFHQSLLQGVWSSLVEFASRRDDDLAARHRALLRLPEGTFGRELAEYYVNNEFIFPGEAGGLPFVLTHGHDARHVLFGHPTTPMGELAIAASEAGAADAPWEAYVVSTLIHGNCGVQIGPESPPTLGVYDPDVVFGNFERGSRAKPGLVSPEVDFLPFAPRALDEVRAEWGIVPGGSRRPGEPWCGRDGPPKKRDCSLHRATVLSDTGKGLVALSVSGVLTNDDVRTLAVLIEHHQRRHGDISLLIRLQRFEGWGGMGSLWADLAQAYSLMGHIKRIAILGDRLSEKLFVGLDRPFASLFGVQERYFDISEYDRALNYCRSDASIC